METRQIMFIERAKVELCTFPAIEPVPGQFAEMHCACRGQRDCLRIDRVAQIPDATLRI